MQLKEKLVNACKTPFKGCDVILKDHNHITGKYQGSVRKYCELILTITKTNLVMFHDFQNYASHRLFEKIEIYNCKINVILKAIENK